MISSLMSPVPQTSLFCPEIYRMKFPDTGARKLAKYALSRKNPRLRVALTAASGPGDCSSRE
jgi:hypothetical protein